MSVTRVLAIRPRPAAGLLALALCSGALVTACSSPADEAPVATPDVPAVAPTPTAADEVVRDAAPSQTGGGATTVGGDGSPIELEALSTRDLDEADLGGELACSFAADDGRPLLHATGVVADDAPARGVVKVAGYVEPVHAPGGFDGMTRNPTFTGQGKTIRIEETGAAIGGGESPPRPATLTYLRADGASRTFDGRWQCGP